VQTVLDLFAKLGSETEGIKNSIFKADLVEVSYDRLHLLCLFGHRSNTQTPILDVCPAIDRCLFLPFDVVKYDAFAGVGHAGDEIVHHREDLDPPAGESVTFWPFLRAADGNHICAF